MNEEKKELLRLLQEMREKKPEREGFLLQMPGNANRYLLVWEGEKNDVP